MTTSHANVKCRAKCAGGHDCACTFDADAPHVLHICRNPHCICHSAEGYGDELAHDARGRLVYAPRARRMEVVG